MFSKYFKNVLKISFDFEKKKLDEKPYKKNQEFINQMLKDKLKKYYKQ